MVSSAPSLAEDVVVEREGDVVDGKASSRLYVSCEDLEKAELSSAVSTLTESTSDSPTLLVMEALLRRRSGRLSSSSASSASSTYRAATATTPWA